ncbi:MULTISPECIES: hypothetical protein [unclassified Paenibacillus]|uniref:hypothetical protein n=1 Tax=unclassified Paenibacillus TaxID=185978 RepID=UPI002117E9B3|nr:MULTISPECIES: hypothetical protein [unclassified Paenibacillus]
MIKLDRYMKKKIKGKKFIGAGRTRIVYDLGKRRVFKVAKSKKGIRSNQTEVILYKSSERPIKKHLARIIDYDTSYRWVTMKKYNKKFPNIPKYRKKLKKLVKKFHKNGILPPRSVRDYHTPYTPNLRLKRNNRVVVIDYGNFKYKR